jgi:hypothetical protein
MVDGREWRETPTLSGSLSGSRGANSSQHPDAISGRIDYLQLGSAIGCDSSDNIPPPKRELLSKVSR